MTTDRRVHTSPTQYARRLLPESALELAPDEVKAHHAAAAEAVERLRLLIGAERTARVAARDAEAHDQRALEVALDAGKNAPKATAAVKLKQAEQATAMLAAARELVEQKFRAFDRVLVAQHRAWIEAEIPRLARATERAQGAVAHVAEAFGEFDASAAVLVYLRTFDGERPDNELRAAGDLLAVTEQIDRRPEALLRALHDVVREYRTELSRGETAIEQTAQQRAQTVARRAIRHQQAQEAAAAKNAA